MNIEPIFKDILPQNAKFLKFFFIVMFTSLLIKTQHLRIIWKIEAVFLVVFIAPYLLHHSVILWNSIAHSCIQWTSEILLILAINVLTCLLNKQKKSCTRILVSVPSIIHPNIQH